MSKRLEEYVSEFAKKLQEHTKYEVSIELLKHFKHYRVVITVEKNNRKRYVSTYICWENRRLVKETTDMIIESMLIRVANREDELDVIYSKKVEEFEEMIRQNMLEDREETENLYRREGDFL